ncbi:hypothetical protein P12x_002491 [Tundrisphaera lichenicola]|uniref:hypothetical protein n=1 Tax=Tundrisphaera lichenicola TaxID=2029860 RepID=UPI003EB8FD74
MERRARTARLLLLMISSATVLGCSSEPSRYAATGTVTIDGAPAPYVVVRFFPTDPDSLYGGSGPTDESGKFSIGQDGKNTGFPSGEYKVTFSQTLVKGKPTLAGGGGKKNSEETVPSEREAVADDYRDPRKTPITASIGSGGNNFAFDIKSKK